jgi:hypothetical protein
LPGTPRKFNGLTTSSGSSKSCHTFIKTSKDIWLTHIQGRLLIRLNWSACCLSTSMTTACVLESSKKFVNASCNRSEPVRCLTLQTRIMKKSYPSGASSHHDWYSRRCKRPSRSRQHGTRSRPQERGSARLATQISRLPIQFQPVIKTADKAGGRTFGLEGRVCLRPRDCVSIFRPSTLHFCTLDSELSRKELL